MWEAHRKGIRAAASRHVLEEACSPSRHETPSPAVCGGAISLTSPETRRLGWRAAEAAHSGLASAGNHSQFKQRSLLPWGEEITSLERVCSATGQALWPLPLLPPPATGLLQPFSAHKQTHHLPASLQREQTPLILGEEPTGLPTTMFCTKAERLGCFFPTQ